MTPTLNAILAKLNAKEKITPAELVKLEKYRDRMARDTRTLEIFMKDLFVPCNGEAHSNPYIDNCGVCMPRWGEKPNPDKVEDARCEHGMFYTGAGACPSCGG